MSAIKSVQLCINLIKFLGTDFSRNVGNKSGGCVDFRGHMPTALSRVEIR